MKILRGNTWHHFLSTDARRWRCARQPVGN